MTKVDWQVISPTGYVFAGLLLLEDNSSVLLLENDHDYLVTETDTWDTVPKTQQVWTKVE